MQNWKLHIKAVSAILTVTLMVFLSEILGEKEILFPETAALAFGALVSEKMPWKVTPVKMMVLMTIAGFAGFFLSVYIPMPLTIKVTAAFVICCTALYFTKSTMLPMISAAILPIITHTESILYPLSVIILTSVVILQQFLFEKIGLRQPDEYRTEITATKSELIRTGFLTAVVIAITITASVLNSIYIIAPPLIVAFAECSYKDSPARKTPLSSALCVIACALIGTISRLLICSVLSLSLTAGVFISAAASMYLLIILEKPFPPAAALAILPYLISPASLTAYPFEITAGVTLFMLSSFLFGRFVYDGKRLNFPLRSETWKIRKGADFQDEILL